MTACVNCNQLLSENYCPNCGYPAKLKRIDGHYIKHEIEHVLHFEKGIFYTIKELLVRPGNSVKEFISENRNRLVKPIIFIIVSSLVYSVINHFFHLEDGYVKFDEAKRTATSAIFEWIQNHYGYANIMMGTFIALWLKLFFRKYNYNFFEILILLCFVMGMGMLFFSVFAIAEGLSKIHLMQIAGIVGFAYCTWAIGQFFERKKTTSYLKALVAYVLGYASFYLLAMLLGLLFGLISKH
ncbi:DUF3667 domain-containing protein [Pedobacter punctiformis]|uniref:DUF3667 domain-containing protein n=1 Tax=Pedobacter punctiformis TaxID=3004097 RepID=A0ABT4L3N2_9SPHI|nr:DUF3667 domain-containing protein [Pedobacter sp. HCMS5-2]MCZ4242521.1 DUF3667 domain-containing protein [Pedobacter sp. HCMS5-2]